MKPGRSILYQWFQAARKKGQIHLDWSIDWNRRHPDPAPSDLVKFWEDDHCRNIIPPSSASPAGFDEVAFLRRLDPVLMSSSVVELGCGYGRLASAFRPDMYLGIDINSEAIERARICQPSYRFQAIDFNAVLPSADLYLAYTVLLHIDDHNIADLSQRLKNACSRLLIVEIMDPKFRQFPSVVPNFVRSRSDYQRIFESFELEFELRRPYKHYPGSDISYLLFSNTVRRDNNQGEHVRTASVG